MFEETMTQDTNAEGFAEMFSFEAEEQEETQDTNADSPQEEETQTEETAEDTNEAEAEAETETTTEKETKQTEDTARKPDDGLEVVFLGEKKQLSKEEAASWAQKGMNADYAQKQMAQQLNDTRAEVARLEAELRAPKASETLLPLFKAYAKASGGTLQDLTASMMEAVRTAGIAIEKPQESNYLREKAVKDWQSFFTAYPDIRDPKNDLPQEVWAAINSGLTPRTAYIEHKQREFEGKMAEKDSAIAEKDKEIEQLQKQIKTLQLNAENKKKAVGGLASSADADTRSDFEKAFQF